MDPQTHADQRPDKKAVSIMSKKRFQLIADLVSDIEADADKSDRIMNGIMEIMNFDPSLKQYNPEKGAKYRERQKELAVLKFAMNSTVTDFVALKEASDRK
jgi:hypothetical protein